MVNALITGITGQDGGFLTELLLEQGNYVHGVIHAEDARAEEFAGRYPQVPLLTVDLSEADSIARILRQVLPDEVYHFAGVSSVSLSWEQQLLTQQVNAVSAGLLLEGPREWSEDSGAEPHFLHASTAEIVGRPEFSPQAENSPVRPVSPYGASKAYAHLLVGVYRERGMHASNAILFNHESPRQPDTFVTRKITKAAADIAAGRSDSLVLGNLDVRRDWGWAPDYVTAMVAAIKHDTPGDYIVATGVSHTVQEFVAAAFDRVGLDWQRYVSTDPAFYRPVDAVEQRGDNSRARTVLGWSETVGFAELVARMVDVHR